MAEREFKAKYDAPCKVCSRSVKGHLSTWVRTSNPSKKGYVHLECWQRQQRGAEPVPTRTDPLAQIDNTCANCCRELGTNEQCHRCMEYQHTLQEARQQQEVEPDVLPSFDDLPVDTVEPARPVPTNGTDATVLNMLGDALWTRIESRVKTVETSNAYVKKTLTQFADSIDSRLNSLLAPTVVRLETRDGEQIKVQDLGIQHHKFPKLLKMIQARDPRGNKLNIWIAGPAGTGKTSAAERAAEALELPITILGTITESYRFFGFTSPGTGQYIRTPAREVWEHGGILLLDDFDGSDPNCVIELNSAFANGLCTFPDGTVKRHPDCVIILTANTWGEGANNDYVGRVKQDKASLDRFVSIYWDTDEALEMATSPNKQWTHRVQQVRANVKSKGIKVLVTPRATYHGASLLDAGLSWSEVEESVLKRSMTADQWASVC